jgi:hypothetical protein
LSIGTDAKKSPFADADDFAQLLADSGKETENAKQVGRMEVGHHRISLVTFLTVPIANCVGNH